MKITAKTPEQELKKFLGANVKAVKEQDKDLYDKISYADQMAKTDASKVTKKDFYDLAKAVVNLLGDKVVDPTPTEQPQAENSTKKRKLNKPAKEEPKTDEGSEDNSDGEPSDDSEETVEETQVQVEVEAEPKKAKAKKSLGGKKKKEPKEVVTVLKDSDKGEKTVLMVEKFPQTIEIGDSKYELATDINTMDDLYTAIDNQEEVIYAFYWSKRHLRQFDYFVRCLGQPTSFKDDLDLATAIYVSDEKKVAYLVSLYTDAMYTILPQDFEEEDGVRISFGMEYQIYRPIV